MALESLVGVLDVTRPLTPILILGVARERVVAVGGEIPRVMCLPLQKLWELTRKGEIPGKKIHMYIFEVLINSELYLT